MASLVILAPAMDKIIKTLFFFQVFIYQSHGKMTFLLAWVGKVRKAWCNSFQVISFFLYNHYPDLSKERVECELFQNQNSLFKIGNALCTWGADPMDCSPPGFTVPGDFPGKNREVGCHALLQGIFWIWGLNPYLLTLLHWQVGSLPLVPPEKPKFLHTSSQSITSTPGNHCSDFFCYRWAVLSVIETYINWIMHCMFFCVRLL